MNREISMGLLKIAKAPKLKQHSSVLYSKDWDVL